MPTKSYKASKGANLTLLIFIFVILLTFLGMAAYTGLTTFVQQELHKATNTAALMGASSLYDDNNDGTPALNADSAEEAATQSFNRHRDAAGFLTAGNTTVESISVDPGSDTVRVEASTSFDIPLLSSIGLNQIELNSDVRAKAMMEVPLNGRLFLYQGPNTSFPHCGFNHANFQAFQDYDLTRPLVDRPGPDLRVQVLPNVTRGYMVLGCTDDQCYDIGRAGQIEGAGIARDGIYNGQTMRVLYGTVNIDLGALNNSPDVPYNAGVKKLTRLRIVDDGVPDRYIAASDRFVLEVCPRVSIFERIEIYHHATTCIPGSNVCLQPNGLEPMS